MENTSRTESGTRQNSRLAIIGIILTLAFGVFSVRNEVAAFFGQVFSVFNDRVALLSVDYYFSVAPLVLSCIIWSTIFVSFIIFIAILLYGMEDRLIRIEGGEDWRIIVNWLVVKIFVFAGVLFFAFVLDLGMHSNAITSALKANKDLTILESKLPPEKVASLKAEFVQIKNYSELLAAHNRHESIKREHVQQPLTATEETSRAHENENTL